MPGSPLIYIVAGEASGDLLGARMMAGLKKRLDGQVRFAGVGGSQMETEGLVSFFPMDELSLIGIVEVLPHLPRLFRRWRETADDIAAKKPDLVLTIDVPGFAQKLVKMARARLSSPIPFVHYVAPTVWAYRPKRANHLAKIYDHLLVLLPFEPPYFERVGLATTFVGHPVVETYAIPGDGGAFRKQHRFSCKQRVLAMLPGSRRGEVRRHMPIFRDVAGRMAMQPDLFIVMPVPEHFLDEIRREVSDWPMDVLVVPASERKNALAACDVCLAKSGTISLEIALSGVAQVTMYRVSAISAWLVRRMLFIDRFNLVNILLGREVIPELMQEDATPQKIAECLNALLDDPVARDKQVAETQAALDLLGRNEAIPPSLRAADALIALLPSARG